MSAALKVSSLPCTTNFPSRRARGVPATVASERQPPACMMAGLDTLRPGEVLRHPDKAGRRPKKKDGRSRPFFVSRRVKRQPFIHQRLTKWPPSISQPPPICDGTPTLALTAATSLPNAGTIVPPSALMSCCTSRYISVRLA